MKLIKALCATTLAIAGLACMPAAAQSDKPLASGELNAEGMVAEVMESVRKDGVLTVRVRFRNKTDKPVKLLVPMAIHLHFLGIALRRRHGTYV